MAGSLLPAGAVLQLPGARGAGQLSPFPLFLMQQFLLLPALVAISFGAAAQCNPPSSLAVGNVTSNSASISFATPTPAPTSFSVVYQAAGGAVQTVTPAPTFSPVPLSNLLANTVYTVSVTSNCAGTTSSSVSTTFTTGAASSCPTVTNLVATNTATTVSVTATAAPGATGYFIDCAMSNGTPVGSTVSATPQYTFTGLTPNMLYRVCISSICPGGGGSAGTCAPVATVLAARTAREDAVGLAPNPASQRAVLTLPAEWSRLGGELLISDLRHTVRRQPMAAAARVELDLTGLAPGLYAVEVRTALGAVVKRLLVQ